MTVVFAAANGLKIAARRVVCAEVSDEGALRMRRTPCGCVPCDSPIENALYGAITGYAARILPVDFSQPPVETDFFAL